MSRLSHRTQSGRLHRAMKALLPEAVFIGFTGTPLLKRDRQMSLEVFGGYIHTYKFSEAVQGAVVLDLVYEARDIDQRLGSPQKIDAWFDAKTRGLNNWQREELKRGGRCSACLARARGWSGWSATCSSTSASSRAFPASTAMPSWSPRASTRRASTSRSFREVVPPLIAAWAQTIGVTVERFFAQRMRTRWGSCSPGRGTIRLNTDLARKPRECLEYIIVHELAHLSEPTHSARFVALMDRLIPGWRHRRDQLNQLPVRHEEWSY